MNINTHINLDDTGTINLNEVAGYLTENVVWQIIKNLASKQHPDVWNIGATAFFALMGVEVFAGKGRDAQSSTTPVPRIGLTHCSQRLSDVIYNCLSYNPDMRPSPNDLIAAADEALSITPTPPKRLANAAGKGYKTPLFSFWPEEMSVSLAALFFVLMPLFAVAQNNNHITSEMKTLVKHSCDLRNSRNAARIERALYDDRQWTLMDEIAIDSNGECTTRDKVKTRGLNQMGYRIAKYNRGVSNTGGRFRNGQDRRYNYSFIEVTAKRGASLKYDITGREGIQSFAVVPYDPKQKFSVSLSLNSVPIGTKYEEDGVFYIVVDKDVKEKDILTLRIVNSSSSNQSFVIINHNSRKSTK